MFRPDPNLDHLDLSREAIVAIIESINHPHIGVPGHEPQTTRVTIVGSRNPDGTFSMHIVLYLEDDRANVVYVSDQPRFSREAYPQVEAEALNFIESMGFMVDNANFRKLSPEQQLELMERLPCFHADLEAWAVRNGEVPVGQAEEDDEPDDDILELSPDAVVEEGLILEGQIVAPIPALEPDEVARIARLLASF